MKRQISLQIALLISLILSALFTGIGSKLAYDRGAADGLKVGLHDAKKKASMQYARRGAAYAFNREHSAELLLALPALKALGELDEETQKALVEILNRSTTPCFGLSRRGVSLASSLLDEKGPTACASAPSQVKLAHLAWNTFHDVNEAVAILWVERRSDVPFAEDDIMGDKNLPVTIIEFGDYQCPSCRRFHPMLEKLLEVRGDVNVVYKHLPLSFHHAAFPAALAVEAAHNQGRRKEMHAAMFKVSSKKMKADFSKDWKMPSTGAVPFEDVAEKLGLDVEKFRKDMRSSDVEKSVRDDMALARRLGVSATPTLWVENRRMIEPRNWAFLNRVVDKAKAEKAGTFSWDYEIPKRRKKVPTGKEAAAKAEKAASDDKTATDAKEPTP
ncbi:MAG: thioredoxin domain-containing protein [Deltaproteobacteria bacterium]|nr:thioredoxin domain-containing protein [Deltaproteobacteria bacterium]